VADQQRGAAARQFLEAQVDIVLRLGVERGGRLIKDLQWRTAEEGASQTGTRVQRGRFCH
jgi:hypothetical protein